MKDSAARVKEAFEHQETSYLPKGELWLGNKLFQEAQLDDNLEGHIKLRNQLGMDLLFLPLLAPDISLQNMDYRRFGLDEVEAASGITDLFLAVVVDGPFQRLTDKHGLTDLLRWSKRNRKELIKKSNEEAVKAKGLIEQCLDLNVGAVVIADDFAYGRSTYINPDHLIDLLGPFYMEAVSGIHSAGGYALFHSCGDITGMLSHLVSCGFDGIAACQSQCVDLLQLKEEYGSQLSLLAGIHADLLEVEALTPFQEREFSKRIKELARGAGFILCSSSGLYRPKSLYRLRELYRIAELCLNDH